jgi:enamine deaminase RidA (YjgF/YER057c/UK114 family)
MKIYRNPQGVHQPLASYTHHIEIKGPVRWLVLSGQVGQSVDGHIPDDPMQQLEMALENISENLRAANMQVSDIVKLTFYLAGEMDLVERRKLITTWLKGHQPCMTLLYITSLVNPAYKIEIDAWACCSNEMEKVMKEV